MKRDMGVGSLEFSLLDSLPVPASGGTKGGRGGKVWVGPLDDLDNLSGNE